MGRRQTVAGICALVLALGVAGAIFYSLSTDASRQPDSGHTALSPKWAARLRRGSLEERRSGEAKGLPALTGRYGPAEGMPVAAQDAIDHNVRGIGTLSLHFAEAQYAKAAGGVGLWIVEGPSVTCIFPDGSPSSSCKPSAAANETGITLETYRISKVHPRRPTGFLALGVVPAGVRAMSVTINGSPKIARVRNGVWSMRANAPIEYRRLIR